MSKIFSPDIGGSKETILGQNQKQKKIFPKKSLSLDFDVFRS